VNALRTPDARFADLPDYPFSANYLEVPSGDGAALRMHYLDEGPRQAVVVLLLHGEPAWSYLYRRMIPPLVAAGLRVVAPDLIGFGKSDKPARREDYSYARHVAWVSSALAQLELKDITLVGQDWGGLIGLRLAAEEPARFARLVAANTGLVTGDTPLPEAWWTWYRYSQRMPRLDCGWIVDRGSKRDLSPAEIAAYDAPFPDETFKAGALVFPELVPKAPDDPAAPACRAAWSALGAWQKPFLTLFPDSDPIFAGAERVLQQHIPGAAGQAHAILPNAGHFIQEDQPLELARRIAAFSTS